MIAITIININYKHAIIIEIIVIRRIIVRRLRGPLGVGGSVSLFLFLYRLYRLFLFSCGRSYGLFVRSLFLLLSGRRRRRHNLLLFYRGGLYSALFLSLSLVFNMCAIRVGEEGGSIIFLCVDYTDNFYFYRIYIYINISLSLF